MIRILVADDERPVSEGISLIVRRDLSGEFEVAGIAASGREAIEKAVELKPDIVLMDVRMPGISGLDAIREIRKRGLASAFILVTAYERFDIARDAVELGALDYLLKPVSKDTLARALRSAAEEIRSRAEREKREMEHLEREEGQRPFVESAFLLAVMLGERSAAELASYREALGIRGEAAIAAAAAFLPASGAPDPQAEARADLRVPIQG
ncbi:MAG: response regulator [Spirochaetaceae bacterium]|nr:response regulator [Spirochaetaceae bacterium]